MDAETRSRLIEIGRLLVNQEAAETLVQPRSAESGFWFGGGDICRSADGDLWLVGRYRNSGDSRTGVEAGPRGAELALLRSQDNGRAFQHEFSFFKGDLTSDGEQVLSIEGASLHADDQGVRLLVSTEKERSYPEHIKEYQKPGTGVWSIDVFEARTVGNLKTAGPVPAIKSDQPAWLHVKDPVAFSLSGRQVMLYCTHPFSWTSSNTGYAVRNQEARAWENRDWSIMARGPAWDVAVFRVTARLPLPRVGILENLPELSLYFYDGAECIHDHSKATPRGYSCEEIGGLAVGCDEDFPRLERLSVEHPLFVSPWGTGCSRYVSVFDAGDHYLTIWQQSQVDRSQPLVCSRVPKGRVKAILRA